MGDITVKDDLSPTQITGTFYSKFYLGEVVVRMRDHRLQIVGLLGHLVVPRPQQVSDEKIRRYLFFGKLDPDTVLISGPP